jgi:glycosyltransferase involved in cell wall biosynthesis
MGEPLVSVIMTSFNAEKYIGDAIKSILDQSESSWELLIADDCSTDNTRTVIATFNDSKIRVFHNEKNLHYLRTRNKLLNHVRGEFIALLDADDLWEKNKLEKQLKAFQNDPSLGLCGTLVKYLNEKGEPIATIDKKPYSFENILQEIKKENVFTGSSIMVKTSIFKELGGYRDFFNTLGYEDYDLTSRIVEKYKAINLPEALYHYRQYPESTSRQNILYNPFKLHGHLLIQKFIKQRATSGKDSLDRNDIPEIINFILTQHKPYVDDPSLIYRALMWSALHRKMYRSAFSNIFEALFRKPLMWTNYRTLFILALLSCGVIKEKSN